LEQNLRRKLGLSQQQPRNFRLHWQSRNSHIPMTDILMDPHMIIPLLLLLLLLLVVIMTLGFHLSKGMDPPLSNKKKKKLMTKKGILRLRRQSSVST